MVHPVRALACLVVVVGAAACAGPLAPGSAGQSPSPANVAPAPSSTSPSAAAAAFPGAPTPQPVQCGQRITASVTLANDLTCQGDALVIVADGVTIDLGGRTLRGPGMGPQTWPNPQLDSVGVRVEGQQRGGITIRNGTIADFSTGVYFKGVGGSVIEGITSVRSRYGLYIHESGKLEIRGNTLEANIYGLHLQSSSDNLIRSNKLVRQTYNSPGGYGIYLFASHGNRITENDIEGNVNWGVWFSEARGNVTVRNNVIGNRPNVSDNTEGNLWHDAERKEGNHWSDYPGRDTNGDGIGDTGPYVILGPADVVDPYPIVARDGWKRRSGPTIDTYVPTAAKPPRQVRLIVRAYDGTVATASPRDARATVTGFRASSSIALGTDERTLYALDGQALTVADLRTGAERARDTVRVVDGIVAANRDGESVIVIGRRGGEQLRPGDAVRQYFDYVSAPIGIASSYKHNQVFVGTERGVDMVYLGPGTANYGHSGRVAYTIPLDGPAGAMTMNRSGTRIYVAIAGAPVIDVVDTEQFRVVARIGTDGDVRALAVSPREDRLFAATARELLSIDLGESLRRTRATFLGTIVDLAISRDGDELYAALSGLEHAIAVVDARTLATASVIALDRAPTRILAAAY